MDKQTLIDKIRQLETYADLLSLLNEVKADLLGLQVQPFSMRQLLCVCDPNKTRWRYRHFLISKKTGGYRGISVPCGNLKWMQQCLNEIFKVLYAPSDYATGFAKGRSVVDNARVHLAQNYVFNIDLKDFFPSVDRARICRRLQLPPFNFNRDIASVIAGLCTMRVGTVGENVDVGLTATASVSAKAADAVGGKVKPRYVLPQGAPTSPLLTNAICDTLDRRLHGLAKRFGLRYSRYADDITFSSKHNVYQGGGAFRTELERIIKGQGFCVNKKKTRLQHRSRRQEVTGLTVGAKVNVARAYVKDLRAILHIWEKYGENAAYAAFYPRYKSDKGHLHAGEPDMAKIIRGKLCYLKMVKGEQDPVYLKLNEQFERVLTKTKPTYTKEWEYLFTCSKVDFEKRLSTSLEIRRTKGNAKPYAVFSLEGKTFLVAVSKAIDPTAIPADAEISLCRVVVRQPSYDFGEDGDFDRYGGYAKMLYLLHRRHKTLPLSAPKEELTPETAAALEKLAVAFAAKFPELELSDEYGFLDKARNESLPDGLGETEFGV